MFNKNKTRSIKTPVGFLFLLASPSNPTSKKAGITKGAGNNRTEKKDVWREGGGPAAVGAGTRAGFSSQHLSPNLCIISLRKRFIHANHKR